MDIYTLIRTDHDKAKDVMRKIQALSDQRHQERLQLFYPLKEDLLVHNDSEENTFYAALKEHTETSKDAKHSQKEHHEAADLLDKLDDEDMPAAKWSSRFDELCKALIHHISEEESRIFNEAQRVLSNDTAVRLAGEIAQLKKKARPVAQKDHAEHLAAHR